MMDPSAVKDVATAAGGDERSLELALFARESARHAKARWPAGFERAATGPYQLCTRTVMDTSDPEITFDSQGVSHWVHDFNRDVQTSLLPIDERAAALRAKVREMREAGRGKPYDCVLGLSGGVDSSYLAVLATELGLRPLVIHFDNGWNSELAVQNIEQIVRRLKLDLKTVVMNWPEFRDLQRSYFKASVLDLEVPTDHMIFGAVYKTASQHGIPYLLSGVNFQTEWLLPRSWYFPKHDLVNLRNIQRKFGTVKLRNLPAIGLAQTAWYHQIRRIRSVSLLDLVEYDKPAAKRRLMSEFDWRDYGGKHHESVFTRFYQGYILPRKFNIDKRKAHLSNLILSGQATRADALRELLTPPCDERICQDDFTFVAKKLGFTEQELNDLLEQQNRSHEEYGTDRRYRAAYYDALRRFQFLKPIGNPVAKLVRSLVP